MLFWCVFLYIKFIMIFLKKTLLFVFSSFTCVLIPTCAKWSYPKIYWIESCLTYILAEFKTQKCRTYISILRPLITEYKIIAHFLCETHIIQRNGICISCCICFFKYIVYAIPSLFCGVILRKYDISSFPSDPTRTCE